MSASCKARVSAQAWKLVQDAAPAASSSTAWRCVGTGAWCSGWSGTGNGCAGYQHTSRYRRAATAAGTDWSQHRSAEPACPTAASVPADRLPVRYLPRCPALQQTTSQTTTPPPNPMSQTLGLGIAGLAAAGAAGIGNLFNFGTRATYNESPEP